LITVARAAGAGSITILLAACGLIPATPKPAPGDPAPVIVTGVVVDGAGRPLVGANVRLDARDWMTVEHGVGKTGMATGTITGPGGRFEIRGFPPTASAMHRTSGDLRLELTGGGPIWCIGDPHVFSRSADYEAQTWDEPVPDLRLTAPSRCDALPGTS
jgi:hypothetical protein